MLALFKSHYSIGKSILTLNDPSSVSDGGPDSIFKIAKDNNLEQLILVEDSLIGFFEAYRRSNNLGIQLIFGLRLSMRNSKSEEDKTSEHKIVIFAKNDDGCKLLNQIYSKAFCDNDKFLTYQELRELWNDDSLKLAIPFYYSFIHVNNFTFSNAVPDLSFTDPTFFIEENNSPIDELLKSKVLEVCSKKGYKIEKAKSIYYKNKQYAQAHMTYKIICSRSFGKSKTLSKPNLEHFCSDEFSFESWKEQNHE